MRFWLRLGQERASTGCQSGSPPSVDVREVPSEQTVIRRGALAVPAARPLGGLPCLTGLIEAMEVSVSESAPQRRIEPMSERAERRVIGVEERLERWAVA